MFSLRWLLLSFVLISVTGCGGTSLDSDMENDPPIPVADAEPEGSSGVAAGENALQTGPFEKAFDGIRFSFPKGWKEVELSPGQSGFIDARFVVPSEGTELELTCSSIGGGIDDNIKRWIGQFQQPPGQTPSIETVDINGKDARLIHLEGTFQGRSSNWAMIGVGIPMKPRDFYLKLNGPQKADAAVKKDFISFVEAAKLSGLGK